MLNIIKNFLDPYKKECNNSHLTLERVIVQQWEFIMKFNYMAVCLALSLVHSTLYATAASTTAIPSKATVLKDKIDLNKADLSKLIGSFKGIGKKRAEAIISYRENHHGFKALEELSAVKGFSQHFYDINREKLKELFTVS